MDCLLTMVEDLRAHRPAVYLADEWAQWLAQMGQAIAALPTQQQRWAATCLVANDLLMPGMPLAFMYHVVLEAVLRAQSHR